MTESNNQSIDPIELFKTDEKSLADIQYRIKTVSDDIKKHKHLGEFNEGKKKYYYTKLNELLDTIAGISIPAFEIRDRLEKNYATRHLDNPEEGRRLFLKHYESIHKPYDIIKDRIWKLLELTFDKK